MNETAEQLQARGNRLVAIAATLAGIGVVLVYSASAVRAHHLGWEMKYLMSQLQWLAIAFVVYQVVSRIDYQLYYRFWKPILGVMVLLLAAVRVPGIGTKVRGAYRWLRVGGFNMQPSELAKIGMVIVIAAMLARVPSGKFRFWKDVMPVSLVIGLAAGLIVIEPDFGTAALIAVVLLAMLVVGGARCWQIGILVMAGLPPVAFYGLTKFDHIINRFDAWRLGETDGAGWQPWMSKVALGSGGLTGVGLGQGAAKLYYLPDAHTDFILAIAGQEFGLIGTLAIVGLFGWFLYECIQMIYLIKDRFAQLVVFGLTLMIGLQAAFNIAVVTASVPPKGISLPFVSFGGSGLCVSMALVGVIVSVSKRSPVVVAATIEAQHLGRDAA